MKNLFQDAIPFIELYYKLSKNPDLPVLPSIMKFSELLEQNPVIRTNLQLALDKSCNTLPNTSISELVKLINAAIQEPPSFTFFPLVGAPINTICSELMQTENGRIFFANAEVNSAIRMMLIDYNKMLKSEKSLKYMNDH
jgi:hypothetical protein